MISRWVRWLTVSIYVYSGVSKCDVTFLDDIGRQFVARLVSALPGLDSDAWPLALRRAMAGSLAAKKRLAVTAGTMPTHGGLFVGLLIGTVLLVGLLNYVPALALGPVVEHLMLFKP